MDEYFKDTYCIQRVFLNNIENPPSIPEIQQKWPILLQARYAKQHFCMLTNKPEDQIKKNSSQTDAIIAYSKQI